jgi:hypothetical protein
MSQPGYQEGSERTWWWRVAQYLDAAQLAAVNAMAHNLDDQTLVFAFGDKLREAQVLLLEIFRTKDLLPGTQAPPPPPAPELPPMPQEMMQPPMQPPMAPPSMMQPPMAPPSMMQPPMAPPSMMQPPPPPPPAPNGITPPNAATLPPPMIVTDDVPSLEPKA